MLFGAEFRGAVRRQRNIEQRREKRRRFLDVELYLGERRLEVGQPPCGCNVLTAEANPAPFGDWMQRRVLQKLRSAPLDPGMRRLSQLRMELLDEPRLAEAGFADDQYKLSLASAHASQRRASTPNSSSRPTKGVSVLAPPLRPPPLARTMRKSRRAR